MDDFYLEIKKVFDSVKMEDGGPGSGHFNHVGIPNHRGGSARSGSYRNFQNKTYVEGHLKMSGETGIDRIRERVPNANPDEISNYGRAIEAYSLVNYTEIKAAYRQKYGREEREHYNVKGVDEKLDAEYKQMLKYSDDLDDFIYQSPKFKGTVYRGINVDVEDAKEIIRRLKQGKTMDMGGISSWTTAKKTAQNFSMEGDYDYCIVFTLPENKSGTSIKDISVFPSENEVLHPTTARYKLADKNIEIENLKGIRKIYIELKEI